MDVDRVARTAVAINNLLGSFTYDERWHILCEIGLHYCGDCGRERPKPLNPRVACVCKEK